VNFRRVSATVTTSGRVAAATLRGLRAEGYDVVVNLLPDTSEHAVVDEATIVRAQGIEYVHVPVDFAAPTHDDFVAFAAAMDAHLEDIVHVHCAANYRVSAFYGLYAMRSGSWSREQADAHLRDLWDPGDHPVWESFIAAERARLAANGQRIRSAGL